MIAGSGIACLVIVSHAAAAALSRSHCALVAKGWLGQYEQEGFRGIFRRPQALAFFVEHL